MFPVEADAVLTCLLSVMALGWHLVQMPSGQGGCPSHPDLILQLMFSRATNFPLIRKEHMLNVCIFLKQNKKRIPMHRAHTRSEYCHRLRPLFYTCFSKSKRNTMEFQCTCAQDCAIRGPLKVHCSNLERCSSVPLTV